MRSHDTRVLVYTYKHTYTNIYLRIIKPTYPYTLNKCNYDERIPPQSWTAPKLKFEAFTPEGKPTGDEAKARLQALRLQEQMQACVRMRVYECVCVCVCWCVCRRVHVRV